MLITLNDVMMRAEYPSFFTGNRKATPFDVVATGSCGVEAQEREL
jgi:hypothetical protein